MARPTIDDVEAAKIAAEYAKGASIRAVAAKYNVSYGGAHNVLARMGVQRRARGGREIIDGTLLQQIAREYMNGQNFSEIAREHNLKPITVSRTLRAHGIVAPS